MLRGQLAVGYNEVHVDQPAEGAECGAEEFAAVGEQDHPVGLGVKKMQEVLAAKTGGKMKIHAFWGGAAGNDLQATQAQAWLESH